MFMRFLKPLFSKLKFRSKLTVNYVIVIFTSVFAVGMYSYYQSVRMLEEKAKQSMDCTQNCCFGYGKQCFKIQ